MNTQQLKLARLARWSQNGEARLTLEDAAEWLAEVGLCFYLPFHISNRPPAPSFLEAVVGRPAPNPSAGERSRATELLARLIENSKAVPLKFSTEVGNWPEIVSSPDTLRFIYALRGDRNFKTGPLTVGNDKVTPLSLHCWQAIEQQGPLDANALQSIVGGDVTETAVSRALQELWNSLYVFPLLHAADVPTRWELVYRRFPEQVAAGACTSHAEALSAMISLYLQLSVAAQKEDLIAFLSPLASQSKLREVIHGLSSMRQLDLFDVDGRPHMALAGGLLPAFEEQPAESTETELVQTDLVPSVHENGIEIEMSGREDSGRGMYSRPEMEASPAKYPRSSRSPRQENSTPPGRSAKKFAARPPSGKFSARSSGNRRNDRPFGPAKSRTGGSGSYRTSPSKGFGTQDSDSANRNRPRRMGPGQFGPGQFRRDRDSDTPRERGFRKPGGKNGSSRGSGFQRVDSRDLKKRTPRTNEWNDSTARGRGAGESERPRFPTEGPKTGSGRPYAGRPRGNFAPWRKTESKPRAARPWTTRFPHEDRTDSPDSSQRHGADAGAGSWQRRDGKTRPGKAQASGAKRAGGSDKFRGNRSGPMRDTGPEGKKRWARPSSDMRDGSRQQSGAHGKKKFADRRSEERSENEPFWKRNPHGGKGSPASSRTNRSRDKSGRKNGKKK